MVASWRRKLPEWVKGSFAPTRGFGDAYGRLVRFFRAMTAAEAAAAGVK